MGKDTSVGWTGSTMDLAWGCTKVSAGCKKCIMFRRSPLYGRDPEKIQYFSIENARKRIKTYNELVFVNIDTDTFHEKHPEEVIVSWFKLFEENPDHQFQILTKRAGRLAAYFKKHECPANCWLGVSVEDQGHLFRLEALRRVKAPVHFVSFEPLLGPIVKPDLTNIQWIIIGGESDYKDPRPMKPEWAQELIDWTRANYPDCAIFFKQHGGKGKDGAGGDVLNGKQYHEYPKYEHYQSK